VRIIQTQIGSATGRNTNGGTRPFASERAQSPDRSSAHRKTRVPRPTHTPAATPSNAHLRVLMSRAVCSVYQRLSSERRGDSSRKAKPRSRANRSRRRRNIRLISVRRVPCNSKSRHRSYGYGPSPTAHHHHGSHQGDPRGDRRAHHRIRPTRELGLHAAELSHDCPCDAPKQRRQSQRHLSRLIREVKEAEGFTKKIEGGRQEAFRLANRCRSRPERNISVRRMTRLVVSPSEHCWRGYSGVSSDTAS